MNKSLPFMGSVMLVISKLSLSPGRWNEQTVLVLSNTKKTRNPKQKFTKIHFVQSLKRRENSY